MKDITEILKLIIALTIWYGVFVLFTNEFNPLIWGITPKVLATFVTIGLMDSRIK